MTFNAWWNSREGKYRKVRPDDAEAVERVAFDAWQAARDATEEDFRRAAEAAITPPPPPPRGRAD